MVSSSLHRMRRTTTVRLREGLPPCLRRVISYRKGTSPTDGAVFQARYFLRQLVFVKSAAASCFPLPKMHTAIVGHAGISRPCAQTSILFCMGGKRMAGAAGTVRYYLPRTGRVKHRAVLPFLHRKMRISIARDEAGA